MTSSFAPQPDPGDKDFLDEGPSWKEDVSSSSAESIEESEPVEPDESESAETDEKPESKTEKILEELSSFDPTDPSSIPDELREKLPPPIAAMLEGIQEQIKQREEYLTDLYGDERFDEGDASLVSDIEAYDKTAYTRSESDLTAYRYNLSSSGYVDDGYNSAPASGDLHDDLGADLDSASQPATGGSRGSAAGGSSYGWGSGWSYYGTSGGWGSRSWMSSWYSGYNSSERAIQGVHNHVATFVRNPDYRSLEILPDLEDPEEATITAQFRASGTGLRYSYSSYAGSDGDFSMVARIDSSLYEKLGISEAQQHYIVDCISQVMAAEKLPDPGIIPVLHGSGSSAVASYYAKPCLPNVTKEIITEILRARGVSLLLEEMPGWLKRVTAFRGVMYVSEPPDDKIPAAFLMYAVWERDTVDTIEHSDAVVVVDKIEKILESMPEFDSLAFNKAGTPGNIYRNQRNRQFVDVIKRIDTLLVEYVTSTGGPIGAIIKKLRSMQKILDTCLEDKTGIPAPLNIKQIREDCSELATHIHDHNRTFSPDPTNPLDVKHRDFPSCPNKALLPESVKNRIELTRKCLFNLKAIPIESKTLTGPQSEEKSYEKIARAKRRVDDMLDEFTSKGKGGSSPEEQSEQWVSDRYGGRTSVDGKSSVNSTKHPELRSKHPLTHMVTDRRFAADDPDFDRDIVVYDATELVKS